ncbi:MAG: metallophosphoesterase [Nitrososphaerota archaeon]
MKLLENWPAILIEKPEPAIVVSDIHFGFEAEFRERGIRIPSQTWRITELLIKLIEEQEPRKIIILGDLKHKIPYSSTIEWEEMPKAIEMIKQTGVKIMLVPGNHDGNIKKVLGNAIKYASSSGLLIEGEKKFFLYHGHRWPNIDILESDVILMGHLHPMINLRTDVGSIIKKPVWMLMEGDKENIAKVFREKYGARLKVRGRIKLIILPAFNPLLTGISINNIRPEDRLWPLIKTNSFSISLAEIILLDGRSLGRLEHVEKLKDEIL